VTPEQFAAQRRPGWLELEAAMATGRRGALRRLPTTQLERLGSLYRRTAADLALARREFPDDGITDYLNGLCARSHPLLFRGDPLRPSALLGFFAHRVPQAIRDARGHMLASAGIMFGAALAGWLAVALRPDLAHGLVVDSLFDRMARGEDVSNLAGDPAATGSFIILNNILVALVTFSVGIFGGLPTAYMLARNGWMLGTLGAAVHRGGYDLAFWSLILPHGVIELTILVLAGGAGLMMGDAVMRPGLLSRGDAVTRSARAATVIGVGAVPLLIVCGCIEALVSPSSLPAAVKLGVAALTGLLLYSWILLGGRRRTVETNAIPAIGTSAVPAAGGG
jgi:uncharacterized membrane protein SpoIIM required for sporulation